MKSCSGRTFNCSWGHCEKSFTRKSKLSRHLRIHTNERPYKCAVKGCNRCFVQRNALTVHSRTHTGEKPHVCEQEGCHAAFADSSNLTRHRQTHKGMNPYVCQEHTCNRSFCRKSTLTKHHNQFHSPLKAAASSPKDAIFEQLYESDNMSKTRDENLLLLQPYYGQLTTPNFILNSQQNQQMSYTAAQEVLLSTTIQNILVTAPSATTEHTQQQYMQMMHQQYGQSLLNYMPLGFHKPFSAGVPMAEGFYHDSVLVGLAPQIYASSHEKPFGWGNFRFCR